MHAAFAQSAWQIDQILQRTYASHPLMQEKRANLSAAQADRQGAKWQRFPTPSAEVTSTGHGTGSVRLDQPLWAGGRIDGQIAASEARELAAAAAVEEAAQELALKVVAAVVEADRQQSRQRFAEAGMKEHEKLYAMIERRVAQEVSSTADQRLAASRLFSSRNDVSVMAQARQNALLQLNQLAGESVQSVGPVDAFTQQPPVDAQLLVSDALANSPTLNRLRHEEAAAEADVAVKRSAWWPQVSFRLQHARANQITDNSGMLVLQAQPGAGWSTSASVDMAWARRDAIRESRMAAERSLRERVMQQWNDWVAAGSRLSNAEASMAMSSDVAQSYARQYTAGRKSWIDVLNAVREATQSELAVMDVKAQISSAVLSLQVLTGQWRLARLLDASGMQTGGMPQP